MPEKCFSFQQLLATFTAIATNGIYVLNFVNDHLT